MMSLSVNLQNPQEKRLSYHTTYEMNVQEAACDPHPYTHNNSANGILRSASYTTPEYVEGSSAHGLHSIHLAPYPFIFFPSLLPFELINCRKIIQIVHDKIGTWTLFFSTIHDHALAFPRVFFFFHFFSFC